MAKAAEKVATQAVTKVTEKGQPKNLAAAARMVLPDCRKRQPSDVAVEPNPC